MSMLPPKDAERLIGHEAAKAQLMQGLTSGKLAHGYLITGPKGIGKATLAYQFARTLLSGEEGINSTHPVFRRMSAGSHADFMVLEPEFDEKKGEYAKDIGVEQARGLPQFFSLTPAESNWRVVIVDSADALNVNAANAILKTLEEPPKQAVLLLISHNPGKLLPTIRSRCRLLKLAPPSKHEYTRIMAHALPEADNDTVETLGALSDYSAGLALSLHEQGAEELYAMLSSIFSRLPSLVPADILAVCDAVMKGNMHANWQLFSRLSLHLLADCAKGGSQAFPAYIWAEKWQQAAEQFNTCEKLHLDYKSVIISFFYSLQTTEAFALYA